MPIVAFILALLVAAGTAVSAIFGPVIVLPFALIPLAGAFGIMRKRVWGAYGLALYFFAPLIPVAILLVRNSNSVNVPAIVGSVLWSILAGCIFLLAGKSLAKAGAARGAAAPWVVIAALCSLPLLFFQQFVIPSGSMENTILTGDRLVVLRSPWPSISRDDMIVFEYPVNRREVHTKRVIGMTGDRIRISQKVVYRNGAPLREPYAVHITSYVDDYRDNFPSEPAAYLPEPGREMLEKNVVNGEVVVPPNRYFVLGDNRDNSFDSRYWGFVGTADVIGRPLMIYDSEEQSTEQVLNAMPFHRYRVRWERIFRRL